MSSPDSPFKQTPVGIRPVIDRNRCEGKADCVQVCPVGVFAVGTLPPGQRADLNLAGKIKGFEHRWQQALLVNATACDGCEHCVAACTERAIKLERVYHLP